MEFNTFDQKLFAHPLTTVQRKGLEDLKRKLRDGRNLKVGGKELSSERLKRVFEQYTKTKRNGLSELLAAKEEFGLEFALSRVFSPKQKDLFLKRLRGEKMTKTESEYFSRTVKKRVTALANPELHRLAQELLRSI